MCFGTVSTTAREHVTAHVPLIIVSLWCSVARSGVHVVEVVVVDVVLVVVVEVVCA